MRSSERQKKRYMKKTLVIVESPAKAKTISRFLGPDYKVVASMGHICDLPTKKTSLPEDVRNKPWADFAVNVDDNFQPYYVVSPDKKKNLGILKKELSEMKALLLATDEDREGEAISWHLKNTLKPKVPVKRIVFHEITREAILDALNNPREIDENLVNAQESRRILDRLFGYRLSPLLWKKIRFGLSAGRVQSPAIRLIVEREEERRAFVSTAYYDLEATISHPDGKTFKAALSSVNDQKVASGKDFNEKTGKLKNDNVAYLDEAKAEGLRKTLTDGLPWRVVNVEENPGSQRPYAPFTTSSLQQEANRKLRFSSKKTMQIAQQLYEGIELSNDERIGLITYMRTDSTTLSNKALRDAADVIRDIYGNDYYTEPRFYQTKTRNAQEAHEAIRPTELNKRPADIERYLDRDQLALYELIWKRTIASQMPDAKLLRTAVHIEAVGSDGTRGIFTATGKKILFPGFLRAYVEGSDDPTAELGDKEFILPDLKSGQTVNIPSVPADMQLNELVTKSHTTEPPARYTEASLIKKLEEEGVGRPSTYATIISNIQDREYVVLNKARQLVPTFSAMMVVNFLRETFPRYVDIKFTAGMEQELDAIAEGTIGKVEYLKGFYHGTKDKPGLNMTVIEVENSSIANRPVYHLGIDPETKHEVLVRCGTYGPYLSLEKDGEKNIVTDIPQNLAPADLTLERAIELLKNKKPNGQLLGNDPVTNEPISLFKGQYGYYVQRGETPDDKKQKPTRFQVPKSMDTATITLDDAIKLLSLPRKLGEKDGKTITATIGQYGPYVACDNKDFRSVQPPLSIYEITLDQALELLAKPKTTTKLEKPVELGEGYFVKPGRYGPYVTDGTTNVSLKSGVHNPNTLTLDDAKKIIKDHLENKTTKATTGGRDLGNGIFVKTGRFGPYVTDGKINATLPKSSTPDTVTAEEAQELLAAKRAKGTSTNFARRSPKKK